MTWLRFQNNKLIFQQWSVRGVSSGRWRIRRGCESQQILLMKNRCSLRISAERQQTQGLSLVLLPKNIWKFKSPGEPFISWSIPRAQQSHFNCFSTFTPLHCLDWMEKSHFAGRHTRHWLKWIDWSLMIFLASSEANSRSFQRTGSFGSIKQMQKLFLVFKMLLRFYVASFVLWPNCLLQKEMKMVFNNYNLPKQIWILIQLWTS